MHPANQEISRFPTMERPYMPGSQTAPDRSIACDNVTNRFAFRRIQCVGIRDEILFAAQWLAYTFPYRRFGMALADHTARLGADVGRYSFIAEDFHFLLHAGFAGARILGSTSPADAGSGPSMTKFIWQLPIVNVGG